MDIFELTPFVRRLVQRHILYQNSNVTNATAKFLWERVERLLDYLGEMFTLHLSPTEINKARSLRVSKRACHILQDKGLSCSAPP